MMKNRYGDEFQFVQLTENTYEIQGDLKYWRFGGKVGQEELDFVDLGFVDPSGGPFLEVGMSIEGREIRKIRLEGADLDTPDRIIFEVV